MNGEGEHEHIDAYMDGVVGMVGVGAVMGDRRKIELSLYVRRVIRVSIVGVRFRIDRIGIIDSSTSLEKTWRISCHYD